MVEFMYDVKRIDSYVIKFNAYIEWFLFDIIKDLISFSVGTF